LTKVQLLDTSFTIGQEVFVSLLSYDFLLTTLQKESLQQLLVIERTLIPEAEGALIESVSESPTDKVREELIDEEQRLEKRLAEIRVSRDIFSTDALTNVETETEGQDRD
jgi:hypothetical protein